MSNQNINYGEGGAASCVLVPPFNCDGKNYDENYISKIASISNSGIEETIKRELILSEILKNKRKGKNKKFIDDHFIIIDDHCILDKTNKNLNILNKRGCNIDVEQKYVVLYSKNGSCKPLKKGDIVSIDYQNMSKLLGIIPYKFIGKYGDKYIIQNTDNELFLSDKITRFCGDLGNYNILHKLFSEPKKRRKYIKHLIEAINFMAKNGLVHCDLKLQNLVCNEKEQLKIIDFGGSFSLKDKKYFNFDNICQEIKIDDEFTINKRTQYNTNFTNKILDLVSIHTEYYTPPEILILKLILINKTQEEILQHILKTYNLENDFLITDNITKIIRFIMLNKKKMFYELQCNPTVESFIYKFDTFSMGIIFREMFKILNHNFNVIIEDSLKDLIQKMTDLNFNTRLNIKQILKHKYFSK